MFTAWSTTASTMEPADIQALHRRQSAFLPSSL
jgi:hypothetical protein